MSQKLNPLSNKLGILKLWTYEFSIYGKSLKKYSNFIKPRYYIFNYINQFCLNHDLLIENINIFQTTSVTNINICIIPLSNFSKIDKKLKIINTISNWISSSFNLYIFVNSNINNSAFLINSYINYLYIYKFRSPKKILQHVYKILNNQRKNIQIKGTTLGIKILELKGFKIEISGCFESSRSQMSKTIKCNFGQIPLTKLNGYIDYSKSTFFTKFGACGLKIWLFYELK